MVKSFIFYFTKGTGRIKVILIFEIYLYLKHVYSLIGVRQGCNPSPMLFNLFLNDLPEIFHSRCDPIRIGKTELSCLLYADDLLILSETETGPRASIDKLLIFLYKKVATQC